jgi:hypothetical protein
MLLSTCESTCESTLICVLKCLRGHKLTTNTNYKQISVGTECSGRNFFNSTFPSYFYLRIPGLARSTWPNRRPGSSPASAVATASTASSGAHSTSGECTMSSCTLNACDIKQQEAVTEYVNHMVCSCTTAQKSVVGCD